MSEMSTAEEDCIDATEEGKGMGWKEGLSILWKNVIVKSFTFFQEQFLHLDSLLKYLLKKIESIGIILLPYSEMSTNCEHSLKSHNLPSKHTTIPLHSSTVCTCKTVFSPKVM